MLFRVLDWLVPSISSAHLARGDVTLLRTALAAVLPLVLALAFGPRAIRWLANNVRENSRHTSPTLARLHAAKRYTPTMGGLFIIGAIALAQVLFAPLGDRLLLPALATMLGFGAIGLADDLLKQYNGGRGLTARAKLLAQIVVGLFVASLLVEVEPPSFEPTDSTWAIGPTLRRLAPLVWITLVLVASSNGVNMADGLDALAGGLVVVAAACLGLLACQLRTADGAEMCVLAGAIVGSMLGFLRFNRHPAQVFMGDTGSLPLGALLGLMAVATGYELLWMLIGGVFVAEAASVVLQVGWFKWSRQRLFRCAPLHHHYQFLGWPECKIVCRFWLAGLICAALALILASRPLTSRQPADPRDMPIARTSSQGMLR
jgi:phospho-N-acetylmuramoyl-pentapeptide-transferase